MKGARILVVDDDLDLLHLIGVRLAAAGYEAIEAVSGKDALLKFRAHRPQLVITDLRMDEMDGLALFTRLQAEAPAIPVIILTAHGSIPDAVAASQRGVFSFLTKPFEGHELLRRVADAIRISPALDPAQEQAQWRRDVVSASVRMDAVLRQALRVSQEDRCALIVGPDGSGKTTLAQAIHRAGKRSAAPFITLACTEHPASELEAALLSDSTGSAFALAASGVLHIRDIGALSPLAQSRLYAALFGQMQARNPLAGLAGRADRPDNVDAQVIATSPRPLDTAVAEGAFRSDLFYLLGGATLQLPPLAERPEDVLALATHFLSRNGSAVRHKLTPDAMDALQKARWPGNVRQLKSVLEQVVSMTLTQAIPGALVKRVIRDYDKESLPAFDDARRGFERDYLVQLLQITVGNVSHAARVAQRNRSEFYKLLARHGLDPVSFKQKSH